MFRNIQDKQKDDLGFIETMATTRIFEERSWRFGTCPGVCRGHGSGVLLTPETNSLLPKNVSWPEIFDLKNE
jgi:hypothetical protein